VPTPPTVSTPTATELLELGAAQRGIWNAQLLDPTSPYYVVGEVLELDGLTPGPDGTPPARMLAEAVRLTVDEAETLRVRVTDTPDGPRQYVDPSPAPLPEIRDLSAAPDPRLLAAATIDAEKAACGERWRAMTGTDLHRYLVLDLGGGTVWCVQLYHHITVDGYSAALLTRRTAAHYTALAGGRPARRNRFAPLAEIIAADVDYRDGGDEAADEDFWRDHLTPPADTAGHEDHVHGAGTASVTTTVRLTAAELDAVRDRAGRHGLVWSDLVLAAYAAWLRKFGHARPVPGSDGTEVVLSMPMMARTSGPLRRTPAMLVTMLPVRVGVDGGATLPEVAAGVRTALDAVRPHQRFAGSDLASRFRDLGGPALLHGIGVNLKTFDFSLDFGGVQGVLRNVAGGPPEDLVLVVTPAADGGLDLGFETDPATVDATTARRRLSDIRALLLDSDDTTVLRDLRLRDAATVRRLAADRAGQPLPAQVPTLDELIDGLAPVSESAPETTLLVDDTTSLTAGELHRDITALAGRLADTPAGAVIALDLPKGTGLATAVLAVWRAHRAFVVLDREYPAARRSRILADSGAVAVLDDDGLHPTGTAAVATPDLAYLLYTSGSTGTPKGVAVTRTGVAALLAGHRTTLYPDAWSRATGGTLHVAHTASFSFDAALDQLSWIFTGATVHLYDHATISDPATMRAALVRDRIDVLDATPSLAGALLDAGSVAEGVSTLVLGGEAVPPGLWDRLAASGTCRAWNMYGPTEATVDALAAPVTPGAPTIGVAVPGMTAEILDVDGEVAPDNEVGELFLSGPQIALGYHGLPDRTAAVFDTVTDPAGEVVRRYRTGDLVRWVPGRGTGFLGRADSQLEIRGHRVEPGEIEAALLDLPEVTGAAVGTGGRPGAPTLVAHVTLTGEAASRIPEFDVRAALAAAVPAHLVPTRVLVHDTLPLTVGGKTDRRALAEMTAPVPAQQEEDREENASRRTPAERALAEVVAGVTGADSADLVPLDRDFIALGGDSIGALTAAGRLRRHGFAVQARDLLAGTTLAEVAAGAEPVAPTTAPGQDAPRTVDGPATVYPTGAVPVAEGVAEAAFTATVTVPGAAANAATTAATMMTAHPALRAVLDRTGGAPVALIPRGPLVGTDRTVAPAGTPAAELAASLRPEEGLVWRFTAPDAAGSVTLAVSRAVTDGAGADRLVADLRRALTGLPLTAPAGSWRAAAAAPSTPPTTTAPSLPVTVHDPAAVFTLLPDLFRVEADQVLLAAGVLATGEAVAVHRRPADSPTVVGDLARTGLTVTTTATDPRGVLLQVKEAPATTAAPVLTVGPDAATLTTTGPVPLPGGAPHLSVDTTTGTARLDGGAPELAAALTAAFTDLAVLARTSPGGAGPSDFPHLTRRGLHVDQARIDAWETVHGPLDDVLPVSPLQEGLLYHAVTGGDGYVLSAGIDLHGTVDPDRLHAAFRQVLDRHGLLRARFDTDSLDEPVQLIPRHVDLPWRTVDLTRLPVADATATADRLLHDTATRDIDLAHGPLVTATLVLLPGDPSARLILGNHHLVTDGWSTPVMLGDLLAFYHGEPPAPAASYGAYLDRLADRDTTADEDAWRDHLDGVPAGTLVHTLAPKNEPSHGDAGSGTETVTEVADSALRAELTARAREVGVTPNTLLQTAWALTLASLTGRDDTVSGTTLSGRPTDLPGIDRTVGLFITTLPARVTVDRAGTVADLMRTVGQDSARMSGHDATPLVRVEQLAGVGSLFDTLVVYDNFPSLPTTPTTPATPADSAVDDGRLTVAGIHTDGQTDFPLSVVAPPPAPDGTAGIVLAHRPDLVDPNFVYLAHRTLTAVLEAVAAGSDRKVGPLLRRLPGRWTPPDAATAAPATAPTAVAASGATPPPETTGDLDATRVTAVAATAMAGLLGLDHVGDHDNFFDIGGHSLLAMRLLGRLRRDGITGVQIRDIVETGSPAALAARLCGDGPGPVLPLGSGTADPLFAIHPGGGLALPFRGLADRLSGHGIPVTGLQLPAPHPQVTDLVGLAALYADTVRGVQAHGPYRLLGYSFGGTLAQALAAELRARGEEVSYLGILDAYPAGTGPRGEAPDDLSGDRLAAVAGTTDTEGLDDLDDLLAANLRYCDSLLRGAAPVDLRGVPTTQLVVATRQDALVGGPGDWDPAPAWTGALGTAPHTLPLDLTHADLATDTGWDAIAPFILEGLS
jgi:non-ribosomal peptide synthetase component F/aryl carrier-like protein